MVGNTLKSDGNFRAFFDTFDDMVIIANEEGQIVYANNTLIQKLGYTSEEIIGKNVLHLKIPDRRFDPEEILSDIFAGKRERYGLPLVRKDGVIIPTEIRVWFGKWFGIKCLFGIIVELKVGEDKPLNPGIEEVSHRKESSSKPRVLIVDDQLLNLKLLETVLQEEYHVMTASDGKEALRIAAGKNQPDIILLDVIMPEMDGYEVCIKLREMPETRDIPVIFLTALNNKKYEEYALQLGVVDYITKPFSIPIVKGRVKNHLEQKKYRDQQKENSYIDELTGIANRRRFNEYLYIEWNRSRRSGNLLSMLMVDVDFFKNYNDFYGHLQGDKCLQQIAEVLKINLKRSTDLVARWGGEEFACILVDTDREGAMLIGERLRKAVADLNILHEKSDIDPIVTVSIGVATMCPSDDNSLDELLKKADLALYNAKNSGRNRVAQS